MCLRRSHRRGRELFPKLAQTCDASRASVGRGWITPGREGRGPCGASLCCVFTGIVREVGRVVSASGGDRGLRLEIEAPATARATAVGDSVSVNGCCLTAVAVADGRLAFDAVPETLARTTLGRLAPGGHYVQGHVDGRGRVRSTAREGDGRRVWVDAPAALLDQVVEKGSIAVDGTSLTVAQVDGDGFAVALIPHTLAETTLGALAAGDEVNLETDVLAKYVARLVTSRGLASGGS